MSEERQERADRRHDSFAAGAPGDRPDGVRERLLERTAALHRSVEAHPRMTRLFAPDLDPAGLADSLGALHAGISLVEHWLTARADPALDGLLPLCDSTARLSADLAALTGTPVAPAPVPRSFVADALPLMMDPPVGPGSLWVLWGAHKGNAVVGAALARGFYRHRGFRSSYFSLRPGDRTRFDRLVRLLHRIPAAEVEAETVPQAMAAFRALLAALDRAPASVRP